MNEKLIKYQKEWYNENYKKMLKFRDERFSNPFFYDEPEEVGFPKVMVIGQEPKDFNEFEEERNIPVEEVWTVDYLQRHAYGIINDIDYNGSPFWDLFRTLYKNGLNPTWNNLDKAHRIINGSTETLNVESEAVLNIPLLSNGKTLLQNEIDISEPDAVLFVTGPDYWRSMAMALQCGANKLKDNGPNVSDVIKDITDIAGIGVLCLWTYHPGFLRKNGKNEYLQIIADRLKGGL